MLLTSTVVRSLLDVQSFLSKVEVCHLCIGHLDDKYHSLVTSKKWRKVVGCFRLILFLVCIMHNNNYVLIIRSLHCITRFSQHTFRPTGFDMLVEENRKCCFSCEGYRRYLNSMLYCAAGKERVDLDCTHTPFSSLTSPEKVNDFTCYTLLAESVSRR